MDIEAYISSGILELYCTGGLTEQEKREVEALSKQHPEIQAEILSIQETLSKYASKYAKTPNPYLKNKILDQFPDKKNLSITTNSSNSISSKYLTISLLAATVAAFFFFYKWKTVSGETEKLKIESINTVSKNLNLVQQLNSCQEQMSILLNKNTKVVPLAGLANSPASMVVVYWNQTNKNLYLNVTNLPSTPVGKQYQLWALVGGKPIDVGVFEATTGILQTMKQIAKAETFAVTLEKTGGNATPTIDQMVVMGKI